MKSKGSLYYTMYLGWLAVYHNQYKYMKMLACGFFVFWGFFGWLGARNKAMAMTCCRACTQHVQTGTLFFMDKVNVIVFTCHLSTYIKMCVHVSALWLFTGSHPSHHMPVVIGFSPQKTIKNGQKYLIDIWIVEWLNIHALISLIHAVFFPLLLIHSFNI